MSLWTEYRPFKEKSREVVAQNCQKGKKKILVMPGDLGHDVELLIQHQVPAPDCHWIVVERDSKILKAFQRRKLLKRFQTTYYNQELATIPQEDGIELAWFDLCGNLTIVDIRWLLDFSLSSQTELFFTFLLMGRSNTVYNYLKETLPQTFQPEIKKLVTTNFIASAIEPRYRLPILTQWLLLCYIFPPARSGCYFYKDTTPMCLYHLQNFEVKSGQTPINDYIHQLLNASEDEIAETILASCNDGELLQAKQHLNFLSKTKKDPKQFKKEVKNKVILMQNRMLQLFE